MSLWGPFSFKPPRPRYKRVSARSRDSAAGSGLQGLQPDYAGQLPTFHSFFLSIFNRVSLSSEAPETCPIHIPRYTPLLHLSSWSPPVIPQFPFFRPSHVLLNECLLQMYSLFLRSPLSCKTTSSHGSAGTSAGEFLYPSLHNLCGPQNPSIQPFYLQGTSAEWTQLQASCFLLRRATLHLCH